MVRYTSTTDNDILSADVTLDLIDGHYFVHCDKENTIFPQSTSIDGMESPLLVGIIRMEMEKCAA
ncbi:hypothetical protein ACTQ5K_11300 [Niallia sp. Sow4_A1]|uniref:hypothetical protein n=1 Tax=Niallia sp. Sow4_A1 TaxID=3438793 RepID=UPI003F97D00D